METIIWRIRHNEEINTLLKEEDIVRFITSQGISGWGMSKEWKIMQCQNECRKEGYIPKEEKEDPG
jgi:hypothetical protein